MNFWEDTEDTAKDSKKKKILLCSSCKLRDGCASPKLKMMGKNRKGILVLLDQPTASEDERGKFLVGIAGMYVRRHLQSVGIDVDNDCHVTAAVRCHTPREKGPTMREIKVCHRFVRQKLEQRKYKLIIPMGAAAVESVVGQYAGMKEVGGIFRWRGMQIPDRKLNAWICPTLSAEYVNREKMPPSGKLLFSRDVRNMRGIIDKSLPALGMTKDSVKILDNDEAIEYLQKLHDIFIAIDYETSGIKPYAEGHRIYSCAISHQPWQAVSFRLKDARVKEQLRRVLRDKNVTKCAAGIKFEETWSRVKIKTHVRGWTWCTMTSAHVIDNRRHFCALKHQAYVNFGVSDYSIDVKKYLESNAENNANSKNALAKDSGVKVPEKKILYYGGLDALFTRLLAPIQRQKIEEQSR